MPGDRLLVDAHVRDMERRNLRPSTIYQRRRVLHRLKSQIAPGQLLDLTGEEISSALDARRITAGTRATEISHLARFYAWAAVLHRIDDPMLHVLRPKLPRRLPRPMPDDDVAHAVSAAEGRVYNALMLATYAGFRACEIAAARWEDANLNGTPVVFIPIGKGGGMSTVPLHPELVKMWQAAPRVGYVFPRLDGGRGPSMPWLVSQTANAYLHGEGIAHTLHSLRHYFGTKVYQASGHDLRATQEIMRHQSPVTTAGYTYIASGHLADAVNAVAPVTARPGLTVVPDPPDAPQCRRRYEPARQAAVPDCSRFGDPGCVCSGAA